MRRFDITKVFSLMLLVLVLVSACKKEEEIPEDFAELSFDGQEVLDKLPPGLKNSSDENAQSCYSSIESAVDMSGFIGNMDVPEDATRSNGKSSGETWTWTWAYGGESFTFYWSYSESGGKRYWDMDIQYNNGPRYSYIEAWETLDGSEGEVIYNWEWAAVQSGEEYNEDDLVHWRYHWELDSSGNYVVGYVWEAEGGGESAYLEYSVQVNADGSGQLDYYLDGELFWHMEWDVAGNGSYAWYSEGVAYFEGTWTV